MADDAAKTQTQTQALSREQFTDALRQSFALLGAHPFRWLFVAVVFLVIVEGLTFIPYIGFLVKLAVASLMLAQWMAMLAAVAVGGTPRVATFVGALALPFDAQWVLVVAGIAPFAIAVVCLAVLGGGWAEVEFFFGHMTAEGAPGTGHLFAMKTVMAAAGVLTEFVPAVVVLCHRSGLDALHTAWRASVSNGPVLLFLFATSVAFECLQLLLATSPVPVLGVLVAVAALLAYLAWTVAFTYAVSTRVLDLPPAPVPR